MKLGLLMIVMSAAALCGAVNDPKAPNVHPKAQVKPKIVKPPVAKPNVRVLSPAARRPISPASSVARKNPASAKAPATGARAAHRSVAVRVPPVVYRNARHRGANPPVIGGARTPSTAGIDGKQIHRKP